MTSVSLHLCRMGPFRSHPVCWRSPVIGLTLRFSVKTRKGVVMEMASGLLHLLAGRFSVTC